MLIVDLPKKIEIRLAAMAQANGLTVDAFARNAILAHLEDCEDAAMASEAYSEFKAIGAKGIPLVEIERKLGLDD